MPAARSRVEPTRTCVVCRRSAAKGALHRIVRSPDGAVRYDPSGTAPGRGAYLCGQRSCLEAAGRRRALQRTLRTADATGVEHAVGALRTALAGGSLVGASGPREHEREHEEVRTG
jgi:predicted RNA-binding protein YlxR (DUF448 family)